jgi:hypothetical protein
VTDSLIDLADLRRSAEDFLGAVLQTVAQPIWVVDPFDRIRFATLPIGDESAPGTSLGDPGRRLSTV